MVQKRVTLNEEKKLRMGDTNCSKENRQREGSSWTRTKKRNICTCCPVGTGMPSHRNRIEYKANHLPSHFMTLFFYRIGKSIVSLVLYLSQQMNDQTGIIFMMLITAQYIYTSTITEFHSN
jgi:hypothetical protein